MASASSPPPSASPAPPARAPLVVGIGGTIGGVASTERALRVALDAAARQGFRTRLFGGGDMARLPLYDPRATGRTPDERAFVNAVREASAVIIASPGYHGSISGVVKNALDLLEETARDARPYLADLPVGLIATAYGWQATGSTIAALRSIVHALRGWPTPFAAAINTQLTRFDDEGGVSDPAVRRQLELIGQQVARFAPLAASAVGSLAAGPALGAEEAHMTDTSRGENTGPNSRPLDDTIAGTGPGIPDDALAPGETELPTPPTDEEVEAARQQLDAPAASTPPS